MKCITSTPGIIRSTAVARNIPLNQTSITTTAATMLAEFLDQAETA